MSAAPGSRSWVCSGNERMLCFRHNCTPRALRAFIKKVTAMANIIATITIPPTTPPISDFGTERTDFDSAVSDPTVLEGAEPVLVAIGPDDIGWDAVEVPSSALSCVYLHVAISEQFLLWWLRVTAYIIASRKKGCNSAGCRNLFFPVCVNPDIKVRLSSCVLLGDRPSIPQYGTREALAAVLLPSTGLSSTSLPSTSGQNACTKLESFPTTYIALPIKPRELRARNEAEGLTDERQRYNDRFVRHLRHRKSPPNRSRDSTFHLPQIRR